MIELYIECSHELPLAARIRYKDWYDKYDFFDDLPEGYVRKEGVFWEGRIYDVDSNGNTWVRCYLTFEGALKGVCRKMNKITE